MNKTLERLHNLNSVYANFKAVRDLIQSGYSFDDSNGPAVLQQLEKALGILQTEIKTLKSEWIQPRE
jgi:hypothetical protein